MEALLRANEGVVAKQTGFTNNLKLSKIMAIYYRLQRNNSQKSAYYGKWYARACHPSVMELNEIADLIQRNCSVKKSDVKAVLTELVEVMNDALQSSRRVKIEGFGSFKVGLRTAPADSAEEFTVSNNIRGYRVVFQQELKRNAEGTTRAFTTGITAQELPLYAGGKTDEEG